MDIAIINTNKRALTSLNISNNRMASIEAGKVLAEALSTNSSLKEFDVSSNTWTEGSTAKGDGPGFAKELAVGISTNGALTSLNISANRILTKEAGKALADALAVNSTLKELDVSSNNWKGAYPNHKKWQGDGPGFARELAVGVSASGALTSLDISSNRLGGYNDGNYNWISDMSGIKALAAAIPECK